MKLAVIPARGGSKRIPRKNIRSFAGRPMIEHSIVAALSSGCFDEVIVSTDDEEIADISRSAGAKTPFIRPANLSDDYATTAEVIQHAIRWHKEQGNMVDYVCCVYATAPFLKAEDIARGYSLLNETRSADYAFSVTSFPHPVQRGLVFEGDRLNALYPEYSNTRSQDLPEVYHDAAQFYWGRASAYLGGVPLFSNKSIGVVIPRFRVQDVDTEEDWVRAELMYRALQQMDHSDACCNPS